MAEHGEHFLDVMAGRECSHLGPDNKAGGADRLVGPNLRQTKYWGTPKKTLDDMFNGNKLKYADHASHMQVEVPKDQYRSILLQLEQRIAQGKVEGVSDPQQAKAILKQGRYSYKQVVKMVKVGTFAGLKYDVQTGVIAASAAGSMSLILGMATGEWRDGKWKRTCKKSAKAAGCVGAGATAAHVATAQLSRAGASRAVQPVATRVVKRCLSRKTAERLATLAKGKPMPAAKATKYLAKRLGSNVVTNGAFAIWNASFTAAKLSSGKISGQQAGHDLVQSTAGLAAGSLGWSGGAMAGAAVGSVIPGLGTAVGGFVGGMAGSFAAGTLGNWGVGKVATFVMGPDDQAFFNETCSQALRALRITHGLSADECELVQKALHNSVPLRDLFQDRSAAFELLYVIGTSVIASWGSRTFSIVANSAQVQ